jgi:hypothetical protein
MHQRTHAHNTDTFLDQGSRSERYLQIKAHFEV